MYELPEAKVVSSQLKQVILGKVVNRVITNFSPHKFAFFNKPFKVYREELLDKTVTEIKTYNSRIMIVFDELELGFWDGAKIRYWTKATDEPKKHQLLLGFSDETFLTVSVEMYGGIELSFPKDEENKYVKAAKTKPNPLSDDFTVPYFMQLLEGNTNLSLKAFLATEQRIPGLGNGTLQDILFNARLHPKRKTRALSEEEINRLYNSVVKTLHLMSDQGGRDSEVDIFGNSGKYQTIASRKKQGLGCRNCGSEIAKESYLGGAIYFCPYCQTLDT